MAAVAACSVKDSKTPALSGPSELGLSLTLQATPDILSQDGSSQSQVIVLARDTYGQPVRNVTCRVDLTVNNEPADFGTLSSRTITTGSDGRAMVTYTAPSSSTASAGTTIVLAVTPVGTDYGNAFSRTVSIRIVPAVVIDPPHGAWFTMTPLAPKVLEHVVLDGSASTTPSGRPIVTYDWSFGDGEGKRTTLPFTSHDWATAGAFAVTLTITDDAGATFSKTILLTVAAASK